MLLDEDPRWRRLHQRDWNCPCCGRKHAGLFDLTCASPDIWPRSVEAVSNEEFLFSDNILTEDLCILNGEHFFVRCLLRLPIINGPGRHFGYGVWSSLSRTNFETYLHTFNDGEQGSLRPWFGWFSNKLNGYPDTLSLKCHVHPQDGRARPLIELEPTQHPLAVEQREGMSFDRILETYALNGHDLRGALSD
jgi:hypothetical protein